jgi:hypothetical protein
VTKSPLRIVGGVGTQLSMVLAIGLIVRALWLG